MKRRIALLLAGLALALTALGGCGNAGSRTVSQDEEEHYRLGVIVPAGTDGWSAGLAAYARERCEDWARDGVIDYEVMPCGSPEEGAAALAHFKTWGARALVVAAEWEGQDEPLQALVDADVAVVSFDLVLHGSGSYRVSGDQDDAGRQSAQYLAEKLGGKGTVLFLQGPESDSVAKLRCSGFEQKLTALAPEITLIPVETGRGREAGRKAVEQALARVSALDGVYAMDDPTALGALEALDQAGRRDVKVVAGGGGQQEFLREMEQRREIWLQSSRYSPAMIADAVNNAVALLRGRRVEQVKVVPSASIHRENVGAYLEENSPW